MNTQNATQQVITQQAFEALTHPMIGLPISWVWRGYGSAIFLEIGELTSEESNPQKDEVGKVCYKGQYTIMLEWSWRVEKPKSIYFGSWSTNKVINNRLEKLKGNKIEAISIEGRLPELVIKISSNLWIHSFATSEGQPEWCLFLDKSQPNREWIRSSRTKIIKESQKSKTSEFFERINQAKLNKSTYLDLSGGKLAYLPNELLELTWLEELGLGGNSLSDLTGLEVLKNLNRLDLGHNELTNINVLSNLTNLKRIDLEGNQITHLDALANLKKLEFLRLNLNPISNLKSLGALPKLKHLDLYQCNLNNDSLVDIPLFPELQYLNLSSNQITSLEQLPLFPSLDYLKIERNQLNTLEKFPTLLSLHILAVYGNSLKNLDGIELLANNLTFLHAAKNQITNIEALVGFTKLKNLNLSDNQIKHIDSLRKITEIKVLNLENNFIEDINPLQDILKEQILHFDQAAFDGVLIYGNPVVQTLCPPA